MRLGVLLLLVLSTSVVLAQQVIPTQPVVSSLIADADVVHVFTQEVDVNYDGSNDVGDLPAQWLVVDRATYAVRSVYTFPWGVISAEHPALDSLTGLMFVGVADTVWAYTSRTQQRSATPVYVGLCTALAYDAPTGKLYISQRPSFTDPGTVVIVDVTTHDVAAIPVDPNPQQTVIYRDELHDATAITICEGLFGQSGVLTFIESDGSTSTLEVGDTPNSMALDEANHLLYVVSNGEHAIKVVDLRQRAIVSTWPTGTSGYDGPRGLSLSDRWVFVSTYYGDLLVFDRPTGYINSVVPVHAKADPVLSIDNTVWVGLSYVLNSYTPTGNVNVYRLDVVGVDVDNMATHTQTPIQQRLFIQCSAVQLDFLPTSLVSLDGVTHAIEVIDETSNTYSLSTLPAGLYVFSDATNTATVLMAR